MEPYRARRADALIDISARRPWTRSWGLVPITREFTLSEAEAGYAVFLEGGLSAIELRSFLDQQLPDWLAQLDPVIAPAVRNIEDLNARDYLVRIGRLRA